MANKYLKYKNKDYEPSEIYYGDRGEEFKGMVKNVLTRSKLIDKYVDLLISEDSLQVYSKAFTHFTADIENNYEILEHLGDAEAHQIIPWYFVRRFPRLDCYGGLKILARLKIKYGSKNSFYPFGEKLNFWPFITAAQEIRDHERKSLLEDTLESFLGATGWILDCKLVRGTGPAISYNILASLFDDMDISLKYEDLFDPITLTKERFDKFQELGKTPLYEVNKDEDTGIQYAKVYAVLGHKKILLGQGSASLKGDAKQKAAKQALTTLNNMGYYKPPPLIFQQLSDN